MQLFYTNQVDEAGCDEAGRGCLAGPVAGAAVILPPGYYNPLLKDSKKLPAKTRKKLRLEIEKNALAWAVAMVPPERIDKINILNASIAAIHEALDRLKTKPGHIIVDGNRFKGYKNIPHKCIVKGDSRYQSIAAASILAKTHRDELMEKLHKSFPTYKWVKNKGYPTREHVNAIFEHGISEYHRKSYNIKEMQLNLKFQDNQH